MKKRISCLIYLICFWLVSGWAQPEFSCVYDSIPVKSGQASLHQWFEWLEKESKVQLSYNSSILPLNQIYTIEYTESQTILDFLTTLLRDFKINIMEPSSRKLVLQVIPRNEYILEGNVNEEESRERLAEAYIQIREIHTGKTYTAIAENGTFRTKILEGCYKIQIHYLGYQSFEQTLTINRNLFISAEMKPISIELKETTIHPRPNIMELSEALPSNKLTFTSANFFSQMNILPGVIGAPMGVHFQVNGGGDDENLLLLDGVPLYHYGHINRFMSPFNGDAIKSVTFYRNYFPTKYEGRLSSVTDVRIKEGNKQAHKRTLSWDMPAASLLLEGPIIKNKLSYLVGARRSWLDFFDELVSDNLRMNHSYSDYQAKLSYDLNPTTSIQAMAYIADDEYHYPDENGHNQTAMRWRNQLYQSEVQMLLGNNFSLSTSLAYTSYSNKALMDLWEIEDSRFLESGISSMSLTTRFSYNQEQAFHANWGLRVARESYEMAIYNDSLRIRNEDVTQLSLFYDNQIRITPFITAQIGINYVFYAPDHDEKHHSIQPRLSLKFAPWKNDIIQISLSRMEQFYHYIALGYIAFPTDFRMPSIEGFKPRSSEHYELGWKHFLENGYAEASVFYKTRHHVLAIRPEIYPTDNEWKRYIMSGEGSSYGIKIYFNNKWNRLSTELSYAYIRSKEWFNDLPELGKKPSLYDIPHALAAALSLKVGKYSSVSVGGIIHSGKIKEMDEDMYLYPKEHFRQFREPVKYRLDAGYGFQKIFKNSELAFRTGLYSIIGNPSAEEIQDYYFIHFQQICLPYFTICLKF